MIMPWAATVVIHFVGPIITARSIINLMSAAGVTAGIGDWRPEKGHGNFGQFRLASPDDPELAPIMANGGRAAQEAAMADPEFYDSETADLFAWFATESDRRGKLRAIG